MIDTHCHLVPGVDDGPGTEAEALALANDLIGNDIDFVLCTPHFSRLFAPSHSAVVERFESLRDAASTAGLPLAMSVAAEVSAGYVLSEPLAELTRRAIGGHYLIVELHSDTSGAFFGVCRDRLREANLVPIYAHPERCRAVQRNPALLDEPAGEGALTQVVAPSLLGRWGRAVADTAWDLIASERVDLVGSDAHGIETRRCHLGEVAALIEGRFGAEVRRRLTEQVPSAITRELPGDAPETSAVADPVE